MTALAVEAFVGLQEVGLLGENVERVNQKILMSNQQVLVLGMDVYE